MKNLTSVLVFVLTFALVEVSFSMNAHAGMITTSTAVTGLAHERNRQKVEAFFHRPEVVGQMEKLGVSRLEAERRIASLNDVELQQVAGNIDAAPAGAEVIVIGLTTILLIVIILLLIGRA